MSTRIVDAVAEATGTDPLRLEPRLYDVVDVEALTSLVTGDGPVAVEFEYGSHAVCVDGDGSVTVDGTTVDGSGA